MTHQSKRTLCLRVAVSVLSLMTSVKLVAAEPKAEKANWDNLKQLGPGQQIKVVLNDAKSYRGKFQTVSDEAIVVRLETGEQTFTRQSILRVSSKGPSHRGRNTLIGLAVGAGAGLAIGAGYSASIKKDYPYNRYTWVFVAPGALVGTVVGAVVPTGGWRDVYRAR